MAFELDTRKLRQGLEAIPAPRTLDDDLRDLKMVGWLIAPPLLLAGSIALLLLELLARL
jgi:hypothetical protein